MIMITLVAHSSEIFFSSHRVNLKNSTIQRKARIFLQVNMMRLPRRSPIPLSKKKRVKIMANKIKAITMKMVTALRKAKTMPRTAMNSSNTARSRNMVTKTRTAMDKKPITVRKRDRPTTVKNNTEAATPRHQDASLTLTIQKILKLL